MFVGEVDEPNAEQRKPHNFPEEFGARNEITIDPNRQGVDGG